MSEIMINHGGGKFTNAGGRVKNFKSHNDGLIGSVTESEDVDVVEATEIDEECEVDVKQIKQSVNENKEGKVQLV